MSGVYDYSTTPDDNGNVLAGGTINIAEGCPAAMLNNAERQIMADIASFLTNAILSQLTVNGPLRRDANYYMELSGGNPIFNFGANRYFSYDRGSDKLSLNINSTAVFEASATAVNSSGELREAGQRVWTRSALTNLNQLTNGPGYITGINSGNVTSALGFTPANKAGDTFGGSFGRDSQFYFEIVSGDPVINLDSNDWIQYQRSSNKLVINIGGVAVASIDASGNLRVKGNVIGNTTP